MTASVAPSSTERMPEDTLLDAIDIRHVRTHGEFVQCVELQASTWGRGFRESVPATILKITQRLGGITAGAFASDGTLLGFIFGITGVEHGTLVHWSDMLAVDPRAQNHGIGRRLKEFQREAARATGATRMYWTFDPLVSRNAHFNLNRLGARVSEYVPDMYGTDTGSLLHSGVGTDRSIVVWAIDPPAGAIGGHGDSPHKGTPTSGWLAAPILNAHPHQGNLAALQTSPTPLARVEIPADIFGIQAGGTPDVAQWFERDLSGARGYYLLAHGLQATSFAR